jgi:hypothetical protein
MRYVVDSLQWTGQSMCVINNNIHLTRELQQKQYYILYSTLLSLYEHQFFYWHYHLTHLKLIK